MDRNNTIYKYAQDNKMITAHDIASMILNLAQINGSMNFTITTKFQLDYDTREYNTDDIKYDELYGAIVNNYSNRQYSYVEITYNI